MLSLLWLQYFLITIVSIQEDLRRNTKKIDEVARTTSQQLSNVQPASDLEETLRSLQDIMNRFIDQFGPSGHSGSSGGI